MAIVPLRLARAAAAGVLLTGLGAGLSGCGGGSGRSGASGGKAATPAGPRSTRSTRSTRAAAPASAPMAPGTPAPGPSGVGPGAPLPAPAALVPFGGGPAAAGEGIWRPAGGVPALYETTLIPPGGTQPAGIAWIDTRILSARLYSGSESPGGGPYRYTAPVAPAQARSLVAAFNGGFQMKDAAGG